MVVALRSGQLAEGRRAADVSYEAKRIPLTCDEHVVREWAHTIRTHADDVAIGLWQEGTRHELWYLGHDDAGLFVIGVMDKGVLPPSGPEVRPSSLSLVERTHRAFKTHWDWKRVSNLAVDPSTPPDFPGCVLLLDLHASCGRTGAPDRATARP